VWSAIFNNVIKHENRLLLKIQDELFETSDTSDKELSDKMLFWKKHRMSISTFQEVHQRDKSSTAGTCSIKPRYMDPIAAVVLVCNGNYIGHIYAGLTNRTTLSFIAIRTSLQNYELCRSKDELCFHNVKNYLLQGIVQLARKLKVTNIQVPTGLGIMKYWLYFYRDIDTSDTKNILNETFILGGVPMLFSKSDFKFKSSKKK
jgi:hypothetical protein